jgi:rubrerythrin
MTEEAVTKYTYSELGDMDRLEPDALRSLFTIELGGEGFYRALADRVDDEEAATLLRRNGREEAAHARRALKALGIKLQQDVEPSPDMLLTGEVRLPRSLDKLWPALIQGEIEGDALYQRWADNETDPDVQRLLRLSGREETLHAGRVEQALTLLNDTV